MRAAILAIIILWHGGITSGSQESVSRQPFTDFNVPEVDTEGNLKWILHGASGHLRSEELVELNGVTVEFYKGKNVDMTLTTPACLFDRGTKRAETDAVVKIESANFQITATGMEWGSGQNIIRLRQDVKVILPAQGKA